MPGELERLFAPHAVPEKVAGGFGFAQGPVFSRRGYLLFSDTVASRIMKWEEEKVSVFRENSIGSSGLTFDHQGRLLACERGRVMRTEKDGKITVLADGIYAPNDVVYAIDGSIYFSNSVSTPGSSAIYQITRNAEVRVASRDCELPDGVALAPNQQKLYAGDTRGRKIWVYEIAGNGTLRGGRVFAPAHANGLKTDEMGNVWAADDHASLSLLLRQSSANLRAPPYRPVRREGADASGSTSSLQLPRWRASFWSAGFCTSRIHATSNRLQSCPSTISRATRRRNISPME